MLVQIINLSTKQDLPLVPSGSPTVHLSTSLRHVIPGELRQFSLNQLYADSACSSVLSGVSCFVDDATSLTTLTDYCSV